MALDGKVAIVTGSSSGIGAETAVCFAARGAKVVITGRRQEGLDATVKRCLDAGASIANIRVVKADVMNKKDVEKIIDTAVTEFSQIDILINNAGVSKLGGLDDLDEEDVRNVYDNNTVSMFSMTKKAMPWLLKTKGCVVNVSSLSGYRIQSTDLLAYSMSKAAVDQFTRSLAIEYATKGVRVNAVSPGHTKTPIFRTVGFIDDKPHSMDKMCEEIGNTYPMHRIAEASEIAAAILFVASDQSSFTTGAILPVSGGAECCAQGALVH